MKFDPAVMPKGSATLDISVDTGRKVLAARTLDAKQIQEEGMSASLKFSGGDVMRRTEIRLICGSEFVAAVQSVEI